MGTSSLIGVLAVHADHVGVSLPASRRTSLVEALTAVPDRRDPRGVVHPLAGVLATAVAAVLAGARSAAAVAEWANDAPQQVLAGLGAWRDPFTGVYRAPDESTFRRILAGVDTDALDDTVGRWILASRPATTTGRRVYSVDGKTLRGSGPAGEQVHLLAVLDQHTGTVLGQVDVDGKTNELTRFQPLLDPLDLTAVLVTADALHTQREHARWLTETKQAGYVFTVKRNQCATRRSDTSPFQAGQTRREVCWVRWLTWIRKVKGTRACQEIGGRVQMPETACRETRAVWRRLDCLNPNLQRQQFTATGKASETGVRRGRGVLVRPGQPSRRKRYPARVFKEMSGAPAAALFRVSETNVGSPSQFGWRCRSTRSSRRSNARPRRTGKPFTGRRGAGDADCEKQWRYA
ncbi:ISAs1 family transposase [Micromonospora tarapacensis]|uniref:ISAs1 family transposase n=1 Tax=Micromonospora tarapacensis TaxID=2835305 RepID=UPI001E53DD8F|nr:ISAs1 family transposase [Micromonospora tarapacensis]